MEHTRCLFWDEIAPGLDFHAALASMQGRGGGTSAHTHADFEEMMYVLSGRGLHQVNGEARTLADGDLLLIRQSDRHAIRAAPGEKLLFINIAYRTSAWSEFVPAAGLTAVSRAWERAAFPPTVRVPEARREQAAETFHRALRAFHRSSTRWDLCRFWTAALPLLLAGEETISAAEPGPPWLADACRAMRDERHLREGVPRLLQLSGVSAAHLARSLKQHRGQTPTEFLNDLRLARAATLLATTPREIIEIAADCGFDNLSYFYRLFRRKHGQTPRAYRLRAHQSVAP